jgi:CO/xanthine dehydrogenase FAD-binding subunit
VITEYHRPEKIDEALKLLARKAPATRPVGGGTVLTAPSAETWAVVDLQLLGLDKISANGKQLTIGATASLQDLLEFKDTSDALKAVIRHEATANLRRAATVAGTLVSADGRSPFAAAMLALDTQLTLQPGDETMGYGSLLPLRGEALAGKLITEVAIATNVKLSYHYVARTPADLAVVGVALAAWPSGRTRLAVSGFGRAPALALDGQEASGLETALENVLSETNDQWASAEYRVEAGKALLKRAIHDIGVSHEN